jgi:DNA-directed RNA polymerase specialized sigma24 family protein
MRIYSPSAAATAPGRLAEHEADEIVSELYRAHALGLIRVAKLLLRDQPSAEDVVQEAFINLVPGPAPAR